MITCTDLDSFPVEAPKLSILRPKFSTFSRFFHSKYLEINIRIVFKWRNLSQTGKIGSGKNTKYFLFLLGLKYTLRTCFESKIFLSNSFPELSNQQFSFSTLHFIKLDFTFYCAGLASNRFQVQIQLGGFFSFIFFEDLFWRFLKHRCFNINTKQIPIVYSFPIKFKGITCPM